MLGALRPRVEPVSAHTIRSILCVTVWAVFPALIACGASTPSAGSPPAPDAAIAALHDRKCGACHAPPQPGTRTSEELEAAFTRHKKRVHLTSAQWRAMTEYLVAPPGPTAWQVR
jgi:hypothetical protein